MTMNILGIDTATIAVGAAIGDESDVFASFHIAKGRHHAEVLTPGIQSLLSQAQMSPADITGIAVDIGPGLFTGLRVGVATAKAMAYALNVPVVGISSLDLLAFSARFTNCLIVPVIDGRRGEVFAAQYRQVHGGVQLLDEYRVLEPHHLLAELEAHKEELLLIGDGAHRYRDQFAHIDTIEFSPTLYPSASTLVELARVKVQNGEAVDAEKIEPLYLRKSDAEVNRDLSILKAK